MTLYKCAHCMWAGTSYDAFQRHKREKHGEMLRCRKEGCRYEVPKCRASRLKQHFETVHQARVEGEKNGAYICEMCPWTEETRERLQRHKREKHGELVPCKFKNCNYKVPNTRASRLKDHRERKDSQDSTESERDLVTPEPITLEMPTEEYSPSRPSLFEPPSKRPAPVVSCDAMDEQLANAYQYPMVRVVARKEPAGEKQIPLTQPMETTQDSLQEPGVSLSEQESSEESLEVGSKESNGPIYSGGAYLPQRMVIPPSLRPGEVYDFRHADPTATDDPRLAFIGAPSSYENSPVAGRLKALRDKARRSEVQRTQVPEGFLSIKRFERAQLKDGEVYELTSHWVRDPTYVIKRTVSTQTDTREEENRENRREPEVRDASVQCERIRIEY